MKPSEEIKRYSSDEDKPTLLWLISQYHMASNWPFVAKCSFSGGRYPNNHRIWTPHTGRPDIVHQQAQTSRVEGATP